MSGTNGRALWERPVAEEVEWLQCGIKQLGGTEAPGCLVVGKPVSLTAVDLQTGEWGAEHCCHTGDGAASFPHLVTFRPRRLWGRQRDMTCWYVNSGHRVFIILKTLPEPLRESPVLSACLFQRLDSVVVVCASHCIIRTTFQQLLKREKQSLAVNVT